ncbi:MAG TPA: hypothetical protein VFN35_24825 [Ktedonobacteraceae bacterium]|nr:hypothetical protein [Ktedonobacteraceae bacterium]
MPLPALSVRYIQRAIEAGLFERLSGAWFERVVPHSIYEAAQLSADRSIQALEAQGR